MSFRSKYFLHVHGPQVNHDTLLATLLASQAIPWTLHITANRYVSRMNSIRPCPQLNFFNIFPLHVEQNTNSWTGRICCAGSNRPPPASPASFKPLSHPALTFLQTHWTLLCSLTTSFLPRSFHIYCSFCSYPLLNLQSSVQCRPMGRLSDQPPQSRPPAVSLPSPQWGHTDPSLHHTHWCGLPPSWVGVAVYPLFSNDSVTYPGHSQHQQCLELWRYSLYICWINKCPLTK